jgi:hypothetical protein
MRGHALLTYDSNVVTRALALRNHLDTRSFPVRTAHHRLTTELLIARDLGWLRLTGQTSEHATARHVLTRRAVASDSPVRLAHPMNKPSAPQGYVTVSDAACRLGATRRTVERLVRSGQLERRRAENRRSYITETSLRAALEQRGSPRPKPTRADLVSALAGVERLVEELREDRRLLLQAITDRETARLELAELRAELERERAQRKKAELAVPGTRCQRSATAA